MQAEVEADNSIDPQKDAGIAAAVKYAAEQNGLAHSTLRRYFYNVDAKLNGSVLPRRSITNFEAGLPAILRKCLGLKAARIQEDAVKTSTGKRETQNVTPP